MWRTSSARRKSLPSTMRLPGPRLMGLRGAAMELFIKLFGDLLVFVYHCFDRIVIHGYLSGLSRPEQVVYFFRHVVGAPVVSKELLADRRLPELGRGLCPQSRHPDAVGREGRAQGRLCAAVVTPNGAEECVGCLLHLQEHGAGAELSGDGTEVSDQRSPSPHLGKPEEPLYAQLLLHPRRSPRPHGNAGGDLLSLSDDVLPQRPRAIVRACSKVVSRTRRRM